MAVEVYYNGFWFPPGHTSRVEISPVYDSTGRYIKQRDITIQIELILYPGCDETYKDKNTPDPSTNIPYVPYFPFAQKDLGGSQYGDGFDDLRRTLLQAGGVLVFKEKGFGYEYKIGGRTNQNCHYVDVAYGPKPEMLAWEPVFSSKSVRIVWRIKASVADCELNDPSFRQLGEFSYDVEWGLDVGGVTTRTINGQIESAIERRSDLVTFDGTADDYRDDLQFQLPLGFKRESQTFTLSEDRRILSFSYVDKEIPSEHPYFRGIVQCDLTHDISNNSSYLATSQRWSNTISGTIRVARGRPKWWAWMAFLNTVRTRLRKVSNARVPRNSEYADQEDPQSPESSKVKPKNFYLLRSISIGEEIYGDTMFFSLSWDLFTNVEQLFQASGMWIAPPVKDNVNIPPQEGEEDTRGDIAQTWEIHQISMQNQRGTPNDKMAPGTWLSRGHANMRQLPNTDMIITYCDNEDVPERYDLARFTNNEPMYALLTNQKPSRDESWISFKYYVKLIESSSMISHVTLGDKTKTLDADYTPNAVAQDGIGMPLEPDVNIPILQSRHPTQYYVRFEGNAERAGFTIPRPLLREYGGAKATRLEGGTFVQEEPTINFGVSVYKARWNDLYVLDKAPVGDLIVTNPDKKEWQQ